MSVKPETFTNALATILEQVSLLDAERVDLIDAGGRIIAEDIHAPHELPLWNNSAMDGYAVCMADNQPGNELKIGGFIQAGQAVGDLKVVAGTAIKVMTGAPTPPGTEAIIPVEDTTDGEAMIVVQKAFDQDANIRFHGEDISRDDLIIARGTLLRPTEINILASFGHAQIKVIRRPKVAILSTGDELVEPGQPVGPGQIVNSNAYSLAVAVKDAGGIPQLLGIAGDTREALEQKFNAGLKADVFITSAGISVGDYDYVYEMINKAGVDIAFWKVNIKPGRPTAFGLRGKTAVFCLPGNPVSTLVTFEEFVRPALMKMQGHAQVLKPVIRVEMAEAQKKTLGRRRFLRVRLEERDGRKVAISAGNQHTAMVTTMLRADGIAILPEDRDYIEAGEDVDFHLM